MKNGTWNVITVDGNPDSGTVIEGVNIYGDKHRMIFDLDTANWYYANSECAILGSVYLPIAWRPINA
jgi:hypothetical protein